MIKECEICGRKIKSGRKYCYEHRMTVQAEGLTSMQRLERSYLNYKVRPFQIITAIIAFILFFGSIIFSTMKGVGYFIFGMLLLLVLVISYKNILEKAIKDIFFIDIKKRRGPFLEYAKKYGESVREEKEFRRSIFHN